MKYKSQEEKLKELRQNLLKNKQEVLSPKIVEFEESKPKVKSKSELLAEVNSDKLKFKFLPPLIAYTLQTLKEINNVPDEMAIQAILGTVNLATQSLYDVDPVFFGGQIIPTTEYFIALAPTAGMKSTVYKMVGHGIKRFEEEEQIRYGNEIQNYKLASAVYTKEYDKLMRSMKAEDIVDKQRFEALVQSLGTEPQKPMSCKYRISTATRNGVIDFLNNISHGGLSSSEAGEFFSGHTFQEGKNNSKGYEMIITLTNLWDGAPVEKNTGIESIILSYRRFTMLFLLQLSMAKDWLGNKIYSEQGFVHRLLITHCDYWDVPEMDRLNIPKLKESQNKLKAFHDRIYELISKPRSYREGKHLELELPIMTMSDEAIDKLAQFDNSIKKKQNTDYVEFQGFVGRLYEHAVRLSATIAIFEGASRVELSHAECGVELAFFYLEQRMTLDLGANSKYQNQVNVAEKLTQDIIKKIAMGVVIDRKWLSQKSPKYFRGLAKDERKKIIDEIDSRGEVEFKEINGKIIAVVSR